MQAYYIQPNYVPQVYLMDLAKVGSIDSLGETKVHSSADVDHIKVNRGVLNVIDATPE